MFSRTTIFCVFTLAGFSACRPKPIDIAVPQQTGTITISSVALNDHTIALAAGYSINSLVDLQDSLENEDNNSIPKSLLLDSATVTISENGQMPVNLTRLSAGVFGSRDIKLQEGVKYTLSVADHKKNLAVTANTCFMPKPQLGKIVPEVIRNTSDSIIRLRVTLNDVKAGDHYFVFYNTAGNVRSDILGSGFSLSALRTFEPKHLELITAEGNANGNIDKTFTLSVKADDTISVTIGKIDGGYYKYLEAYKRTGFLINQLTGEPINLPTNVSDGYGYFSLYVPERQVFELAKY